MSKRPNEASGSEPVAKRTAGHLAEHLTLEDTTKAQAALDRLDFKTAEEICTQVSNKTHYLVIDACAISSRCGLSNLSHSSSISWSSHFDFSLYVLIEPFISFYHSRFAICSCAGSWKETIERRISTTHPKSGLRKKRSIRGFFERCTKISRIARKGLRSEFRHDRFQLSFKVSIIAEILLLLSFFPLISAILGLHMHILL